MIITQINEAQSKLKIPDYIKRALSLNGNNYTGWQVGCDYMSMDERQGWSQCFSFKNLSGCWLDELDELNELSSWYFFAEFDEVDTWRLGVQLWLRHPRKGASRGIEIKDLSLQDFKAVLKIIKDGFGRIVNWHAPLFESENKASIEINMETVKMLAKSDPALLIKLISNNNQGLLYLVKKAARHSKNVQTVLCALNVKREIEKE